MLWFVERILRTGCTCPDCLCSGFSVMCSPDPQAQPPHCRLAVCLELYSPTLLLPPRHVASCSLPLSLPPSLSVSLSRPPSTTLAFSVCSLYFHLSFSSLYLAQSSAGAFLHLSCPVCLELSLVSSLTPHCFQGQ